MICPHSSLVQNSSAFLTSRYWPRIYQRSALYIQGVGFLSFKPSGTSLQHNAVLDFQTTGGFTNTGFLIKTVRINSVFWKENSYYVKNLAVTADNRVQLGSLPAIAPTPYQQPYISSIISCILCLGIGLSLTTRDYRGPLTWPEGNCNSNIEFHRNGTKLLYHSGRLLQHGGKKNRCSTETKWSLYFRLSIGADQYLV